MNTNLAEVIGMDGKKLSVVNGKKKEQKLTKDGRIKQTPNNSKINREYVLPFKEEDILKMIEHFDMRIMCASDDENREIAVRNKYLFIMGINSGLRVSDLCSLTWNDLFDDKGNLRESKVIKPWKTRNINKHINQEFNKAFRMAVISYIKENKIAVNIDRIKECASLEKKLSVKVRSLETMKKSIKKSDKYSEDDINLAESEVALMENQQEELIQKLYVFPSREGGHIKDGTIRKMIVDGSKACGIIYNTSTHSMRKTYCRLRYDNADDKTAALHKIMEMLGHSAESITLRYIGITQEEIKEFANELDIGIDISDDDKDMLENFRL